MCYITTLWRSFCLCTIVVWRDKHEKIATLGGNVAQVTQSWRWGGTTAERLIVIPGVWEVKPAGTLSHDYSFTADKRKINKYCSRIYAREKERERENFFLLSITCYILSSFLFSLIILIMTILWLWHVIYCINISRADYLCVFHEKIRMAFFSYYIFRHGLGIEVHSAEQWGLMIFSLVQVQC